METILIPQPDTIPVSWGWFQFLLLLTFPLHLLAMNAMVGGLLVGVVQHMLGGEVRSRLAHRIAVVLPLVVATVVNLGVAPLLFLQVLYGQFNYTSSVMMGTYWIMIVPLLIVAYYGAYLYDFKFSRLGRFGIIIGLVSLVIFLAIGSLLSNNMLLMTLPEQFANYFSRMDGTTLIFDHPEFLLRYSHMMTGAVAVGGLFVALLTRFRADRDMQLAEHGLAVGMRVFLVATVINMGIGIFYLMALPREQMLVFMGGDIAATIAFAAGLLLSLGVLIGAWKEKLWLTVGHLIPLVYVMVFMRGWLRSAALRDYFSLDQLQVIPQYSPMLFFVVTLLIGIGCLAWLWKKTADAFAIY